MIRVLMPTYHRTELFALSIRSLQASIQLESLQDDEFHVYIYDNHSEELLRDLLRKLRDAKPSLFTVVFGKKNIGKAKALNSFMDEIQPDDVVVSMDSDIQIASTGFFRTGLRLIRTFPVAAIASWQTVNNHHKIEQEWKDAAGGYHYKSDSIGGGIAGGCFFTMGSTWKLTKGYRENRGLFGGNDGWFFYDAGIKTGLPIWLCKELVVAHPPDTDEGYAEWKKTAQEQQGTDNKCLHATGYFDKKPEEKKKKTS